ncbi:MAG: nucleoside triphosphate pyrophosphohydrolase [Limnochordia bacterium]
MGKPITVLGLGPGPLKHMTLEAWELLNGEIPIYVRTEKHPACEELKERGIACHFFDYHYEKETDFEAVYEAIVEELLAAAKKGPILYCVPGHPLIGERTVALLLQRWPEGVTVKPAMGFLDPLLVTAGFPLEEGLSIVDAFELDVDKLNFAQPLVIMQVYDRYIAGEVKLKLLEVLPEDHPVQIITGSGTQGEKKRQLPLYALDQGDYFDHLTSLFIPAHEKPAINRLQEVMAILRSPEGCPWDRQQDHRSLRPYLIEEAYEVAEAVGNGDLDELCEELGDVLLQVVFHAQIASETGSFRFNDVVQGIIDKMVRRHPHVFGTTDVDGVGEVLRNWEAIKRQEGKERKSILAGIPKDYPALMEAWDLQAKAAKVGFEWPDVGGAIAKVGEELGEFYEAAQKGDPTELEDELGDVFFTIVNVARYYGVNPELALQGANKKFRERFQYIEREAAKQGRNLEEMTLEEMDALWDEAKVNKS